MISEYTQNEKNRVFGKGAVACEELEQTVDEQSDAAANQTADNATLRFLDKKQEDSIIVNLAKERLLETSSYDELEFFVVMPNLFQSEADLTGTKSIIEGQQFRLALETSQILEDLNISSITCSFSNDYPI